MVTIGFGPAFRSLGAETIISDFCIYSIEVQKAAYICTAAHTVHLFSYHVYSYKYLHVYSQHIPIITFCRIFFQKFLGNKMYHICLFNFPFFGIVMVWISCWKGLRNWASRVLGTSH